MNGRVGLPGQPISQALAIDRGCDILLEPVMFHRTEQERSMSCCWTSRGPMLTARHTCRTRLSLPPLGFPHPRCAQRPMARLSLYRNIAVVRMACAVALRANLRRSDGGWNGWQDELASQPHRRS